MNVVVEIDRPSEAEESKIEENKVDPFADFDELENDDMDEFKPVEAEQIYQQSTINQPKINNQNDNSFVLDYKNTVQPIIKIVEKIVFLP